MIKDSPHRHLLEDQLFRQVMDLPEDQYYVAPQRLNVANPKPGYVLFTRRPRTDLFRITWANGASITRFGTAPRIVEEIEKMGIERSRVERGLDHIWNFQFAYVKLNDGAPDEPPLKKPPTQIRTGLG